MSLIQIDTVFNIELDFELAPFPKRLLAYFIDFGILILYLYSMQTFVFNALGYSFSDNIGITLLVTTLPMLLYSLIMEIALNGQTIGKKICNIRVVSLDGANPTTGQFVIRWITKFFEWPFLFGMAYFSTSSIIAYVMYTGFLGIAVVICIAVTKKNQRLGDLAAGTVLVKTKTDYTVNDTVFMEISNTNYKVTFPEVMRLSDNDINTIKSVLTQALKNNNLDVARRVEAKIKSVLQIESTLYPIDFLEKLLEDYNYLATKE